jgi:anti-sigma regulatory factor (Ser/Thr protein kinase)
MDASNLIVVDESSRVAEARRIGRQMALNAGLGEVEAEQVAIAVTEACTNQLKHAAGGQLLLHTTTTGHQSIPQLEMLAIDRGPGMTNLEQCIEDGFSTAGSAGQGLGAIIRLSKESDFYSIPDKGTAVMARWSGIGSSQNGHAQLGVLIGGVNISKPGQEVCGDSWGSVWSGDILTVLMADGLGHGMEARMASFEAVRQLYENLNQSPKMLVDTCHRALRSTRGAAVAVVQIDTARMKLTFSGVGNLSARVYSGSVARQHLVSVNGTAGHQAERLQEFSYPWPDDGLLVFHSDGLTTGAGLERYPGLALRDPALIASVLYRDFTRGHDDSTVVVAKAA